jgi:catechol 2,3-dioxygenase-like lactoylglutathione lyase family enzyme
MRTVIGLIALLVLTAPARVAVADTPAVEAAPVGKSVARRTTFIVTDLDRSIRFYEALGFTNDRRVEVTDAASLKVFGLPPDSRLTFARMTSDNTLATGRIDGGTIGLAQVHEPALPALRDLTRDAPLRGMPILVMTTDGIAAVHARLTALGAEILEPPMAMPGGMQSMIVRDPDGTRMEITQLPPPPPR